MRQIDNDSSFYDERTANEVSWDSMKQEKLIDITDVEHLTSLQGNTVAAFLRLKRKGTEVSVRSFRSGYTMQGMVAIPEGRPRPLGRVIVFDLNTLSKRINKPIDELTTDDALSFSDSNPFEKPSVGVAWKNRI